MSRELAEAPPGRSNNCASKSMIWKRCLPMSAPPSKPTHRNARAMNTNIDGAKAMAGLAIVLALLIAERCSNRPSRYGRTYQGLRCGRDVGRSVS